MKQQNTLVCQLQQLDWTIVCSDPDTGSDASLLHNIRSVCVAPRQTKPMGMGVLFQI
jgi:hypothetical protein